MVQFSNSVYEGMVREFLSDTFYVANRSNRGKISTIRSYTEVIVRRILDLPIDRKITLGDKEIRKELARVSNNNAVLLRAINIICDDGGDYTHTQVIETPTDELVQRNIDCLFDLYAYLLIAYFEKYRFGSNSRVLSAFSTLPPIIRYKTLKYLYEKDQENIAIIDKFSLAILKSFNREVALEWLEENKNMLINISSISKEAKKEYIDKGVGEILQILDRNMYDFCLAKINLVGRSIDKSGKAYEDFEEAIDIYKQNGIISTDSEEEKEFNSIMEFLYLGRKSKNHIPQ